MGRRMDTKYVFCVVGLPPGGGKSTFFKALKEVASAEEVELDVSVVSSDKCQGGRQEFESKIRSRMQSSKVVGYDKNLPNKESLEVLRKALKSASGKYNIKLILICPESLDRSMFWKRVLARPASHKGLAVRRDESLPKHLYLPRKKCEEIFQNSFFHSCKSDLKYFQNLSCTKIVRFFTAARGLYDMRLEIKDIFSSLPNGHAISYTDFCTILDVRKRHQALPSCSASKKLIDKSNNPTIPSSRGSSQRKRKRKTNVSVTHR